MAQLVEALRYKPEGRDFDSSSVHTDLLLFSQFHSLSLSKAFNDLLKR